MAGQLTEGHQPRARLDLPRRPGPRPVTHKLPPHTQLDAEPVAELVDELARHCFSLPDVHEEPTRISVPGARALVADVLDAAVPSARAMGGEFAHIHPDGSMHATLSLPDAETAIDAGWAEPHPMAASFEPGMVMLYTPRDGGELEVIKILVDRSWAHVLGRRSSRKGSPGE